TAASRIPLRIVTSRVSWEGRLAFPSAERVIRPRRSIMSSMLLHLSLAVVLAPAPADEKINLPSGPPPQTVLAVIKDGKCEVTYPMMVPVTREEVRTRVVNVDGKQVPVQEKVAVTSYQIRHTTSTLDRPRAFDRSGKEVDAKRLA